MVAVWIGSTRREKWLDKRPGVAGAGHVACLHPAMCRFGGCLMADDNSDIDLKESARGGAAPRHSRRLSDKILIAFHHACDQGDFEVAEQLLRVLEMMLTRRPVSPDTNRRRNMESLVAAHERLWHLRHPQANDV